MKHQDDERAGRPGDGKDWYPDIVERPDRGGWGPSVPEEGDEPLGPDGDGDERTS